MAGRFSRKNVALVLLFTLLLVLIVGASLLLTRKESPVVLALEAGPQSWWACALPSFSGSAYRTAIYLDNQSVLQAMEEETADAALVPYESLSALPAGYKSAAVVSCLTLTAVEQSGAKAATLSAFAGRTALIPQALRDTPASAMLTTLLERSGVALDLRYVAEEEILAAAQNGTLELAFLPADLAAQVTSAQPALRPSLDLADAWEQTAGAPPAAWVLVLSERAMQQKPNGVRELLSACESSLGYAHKSHRKAALLAVEAGLDGGYDAAQIQAMLPRAGYRFLSGAQARTSIQARAALEL